MPEELRDLMGRAVEGPVSPVDADEVWKRGSRERRIRRLAQVAPLVVIVGLVIGLVAVASGGDDEAGVADTSADDQIAAHLALNAAVNEAVGAIAAEGQVSLGWTAEVATDEDLAAARAATDVAVDAYRQVLAEMPSDLVDGDASVAAAIDVATTRIDALPTIREAVDQDLHPTYAAVSDSFAVTTMDLLELDRVVASQLPSAPAYLRSATVQSYVGLQPTALRSSAAVFELLESDGDGVADAALTDLRQSLDREAELHADFMNWANPDQKIIERAAGPGQDAYTSLTNLVADREPEASSGDADPTVVEAYEVILAAQIERAAVTRRLVAGLATGGE
jgi:hypothetical protein